MLKRKASRADARLFHFDRREWFDSEGYEKKTNENSRVSVPADTAVQSDINEHGHANDNIYTGG